MIALIAVTHVFVAHFAVGGGLYLVLAERKGLKERSSKILEFTRSHAKFFILVTLVYGSITGVGIWWIISLVNPAATSLLIHNFVFGWAAEWVFFVVEILAAFIYFYMFGKMEPPSHQKIGWMYFFSAWMSLVLINGIVAFMLTPGRWVQDQNFWSGFLNPSFLPSMFFRTFLAFLIAGAFGYVTSSFSKDRVVRVQMTRFSAKWCLVAVAGIIPSAYWYLKALPTPAQELVMGKSPTIEVAKLWGLGSLIAIIVVSIVAGMVLPKLNNKITSLVVFVSALLFMGSFEWTREAARRPYVINQVMYSNMIFENDLPQINETGFLKMAKWVKNRNVAESKLIDAGREIFIHQCYACHTIGGINNDIVVRTKGMSLRGMVKYIERIHRVRYFMPPFAGTEEEAKALAAFIVGGLHGKPIEKELPPVAALPTRGDTLFEDNCSSCHSIEEMRELIADRDRDTLRDMLDRLEELSDEMPPFEGTSQEKDLLADYLYTIKEGRS